MNGATETVTELPDDLVALKAIVLAQAHEKKRLEAEVDSLREQLNLLLHKRFACSSEQGSPDQLRLFNVSST